MRTRGTPTRLELHRLKYHQMGKTGPLLVGTELTEEEKDILNRAVAKDIRVKDLEFCDKMDEKIYDQVQAEVYSDWGVMCPHYIDIDKTGSHCPACGASVFAAHGSSELVRKLLKKFNK